MRRHGRVPLLRRSRARMGMAGPAAPAAACAVPRDVGDPRRRHGDRRGSRAAHRSRVARVTGVERPVPLSYRYVMTPVHETVEQLLADGLAPVYIVHFSQAAAVERAQALSSAKVATREERDAIAEELGGFRFAAGFGATLSRLIRPGIGVHHAGMLPKYRRLVEQLAQRGLLQRDLRHRHARCRHQRAHPHRVVHGAHQVRRNQDAPAHRSGVPSDRRTGGPRRIRHRGRGGGRGAGARDRERAGRCQGRAAAASEKRRRPRRRSAHRTASSAGACRLSSG